MVWPIHVYEKLIISHNWVVDNKQNPLGAIHGLFFGTFYFLSGLQLFLLITNKIPWEPFMVCFLVHFISLYLVYSYPSYWLYVLSPDNCCPVQLCNPIKIQYSDLIDLLFMVEFYAFKLQSNLPMQSPILKHHLFLVLS